MPDAAAVQDPRSAAFAAALGARLAALGLIDELSLRRAERAREQSGERFDLVLTRLGLVPEAELAGLLAEHAGLRLVGRGDMPLEPLLAEMLKPAFLEAHRLLPIAVDGERVTIAVADPFESDAVAAIAYQIGRPVTRVVATPGDISRAIERLYHGAGVHAGAVNAGGIQHEASADDIRRLEDMASEAPIIRLVHQLIARAVEARASDIHLEPREEALDVRLRIDGLLHTAERLPLALTSAVTSRIKVMAQLNIAERRLPQDGRIASTVLGRAIDLRVSTMPTLHGESVVLRLLDRASLALDLGALGFSTSVHEGLLRLLEQPNGIVLVTGPTGSGKTTTLYAALARLADEESKILTVEDPVEYQLAGISQIQVSPRIGLTFAHTLRSILRQDPDVILVGEIRDLETAEIAIQASLTGHLVLSSVHTNGAAATVTRLIDMGVEGYLIASSVTGVLAQRLVRRLCPRCAEPAEPAPSLLDWLGREGHLAGHADASGLERKVGCPACRGTGFSGRTSIGELLVMSDEVRAAILSGRPEQAIEQAALAGGMVGMLRDGVAKALAGETTLEEVLRATRVT
jgi:general secretion pathway protein E